jgi:hypothetical protein
MNVLIHVIQICIFYKISLYMCSAGGQFQGAMAVRVLVIKILETLEAVVWNECLGSASFEDVHVSQVPTVQNFCSVGRGGNQREIF